MPHQACAALTGRSAAALDALTSEGFALPMLGPKACTVNPFRTTDCHGARTGSPHAGAIYHGTIDRRGKLCVDRFFSRAQCAGAGVCLTNRQPNDAWLANRRPNRTFHNWSVTASVWLMNRQSNRIFHDTLLTRAFPNLMVVAGGSQWSSNGGFLPIGRFSRRPRVRPVNDRDTSINRTPVRFGGGPNHAVLRT
jgi:hypothetical protein